mmetsp:Transcript_10220/g.29187  ORF Transcript_10220/g.29187 Transcript_10220/m.29187 type:complete len:229 (-) Transcript_10220:1741-2427(-)
MGKRKEEERGEEGGKKQKLSRPSPSSCVSTHIADASPAPVDKVPFALPSFKRLAHSSEVLVHSPVCLVSLQVLPLNQTLDALFDERRVWHEPRTELPRHFSDEVVMLQRLSRLHYPHNAGLHQQPSILFDGCGYVSSRCWSEFFHRHKRNLHSFHFARVLRIESKGVVISNVLAFARLAKDAVLWCAERDQVAAKVVVGDLELAELSQREGRGAVEHHKDAHLVRAHD